MPSTSPRQPSRRRSVTKPKKTTTSRDRARAEQGASGANGGSAGAKGSAARVDVDGEGGARDARKKAILKAAVKVFAEKGYHGCRISDVAEEAGVAYGLVYHYFGNKDALLRSIFETNWAVFLKAVDAIVESDGPVREKVRQIIDFLVNAYEMSPLIVKVLILEFGRSSRLGDALDTPEMNHVFVAVQRLLAEAHEKGELREGIEPHAAAVILLGAVESALASFVVSGRGPHRLNLEDTRRSLHTVFTDGFLQPPTRAKRAR